ncbi:MAG: DUF4954 family protein, partial [Phycisphaerales bacterium]
MSNDGFQIADFKSAMSNPDAVYDSEWVDIAGQLMPKKRLADLEDAIEAGKVDSVEALSTRTKTIHECYQADEWAWVCRAYEQVFGEKLEALDAAKLCQVAAALGKVRTKFLNLVAADAKKEFSELSHIGFGQDGNQEDVAADFRAVRGTYEENPFVQEIRQNIERLQQRVEGMRAEIKNEGSK